jgi:hypothetical protein
LPTKAETAEKGFSIQTKSKIGFKKCKKIMLKTASLRPTSIINLIKKQAVATCILREYLHQQLKMLIAFTRHKNRRVNPVSKDSAPEPKRSNLWFMGLYFFVLEPLLNQVKSIPFLVRAILRRRSLEPLLIAIREFRYNLSPNPCCSVCGQKVKRKWVPIQESLVDPILDETSKPFDPAYIGCKYCDSFFEAKSIYGDIIIEEGGKPLESW